VYRSEVSFFLAVHLDVCNMPIILMNVLILALSIFRFILIVLHLLVFKLSFHFSPITPTKVTAKTAAQVSKAAASMHPNMSAIQRLFSFAVVRQIYNTDILHN